MLIERAVLDRIVDGEVDSLSRRQKRPTVKTGGALGTAVGMLEIVSVEPVELGDVARRDASDRLGTAPFKAAVSKLKALGPTFSLSPGYELSPRGRVVLTALAAPD